MMETLRKHMKKIIWGIAMMFIAGIFFWYGSGKVNTDIVAKIGKYKITGQEFRRTVSLQLRNLRENSKTEITDEQILEVRQQVLSSMVNQQILFAEGLRSGIIVTDEEVVNTIHNLPQFRQDDKFSFQLYHQVLRYNLNMTPEQFEEDIRKNITVRKLERRVLGTAEITDSELLMHYGIRSLPQEEYATRKDELKNDLMQEKRMSLYRNWMQTLHQKYKLEIDAKVAGLK